MCHHSLSFYPTKENHFNNTSDLKFSVFKYLICVVSPYFYNFLQPCSFFRNRHLLALLHPEPNCSITGVCVHTSPHKALCFFLQVALKSFLFDQSFNYLLYYLSRCINIIFFPRKILCKVLKPNCVSHLVVLLESFQMIVNQ